MALKELKVVGLDPGLTRTGWGVVSVRGSVMKHVANGFIKTQSTDTLPNRLVEIHRAIEHLIQLHRPNLAAVEETFVNKNASSTLKLNHARTVAILVPSLYGIPVESYAPNHIKKAVVGYGHADKEQIHTMVRLLLPGVMVASADASDALAIAICHAHHFSSNLRIRSGAAV